MKRLESNLLNMSLSLTLVTLVAAGLLGSMYVLTKEPIEKSKLEKQTSAKTEVLPEAAGVVSFSPAEEINGVKVYRAYLDDEEVGAAVETFDPNGFNGKFSIMLGLDKNGVITGYKVLEQNETPGLGANMVHWFKTDKGNQNIVGINPAEKNLTVSKDGGDVDAITAATITSRAFLRAVQRGYDAYMNQAVDAHSSATRVEKSIYNHLHDLPLAQDNINEEPITTNDYE